MYLELHERNTLLWRKIRFIRQSKLMLPSINPIGRCRLVRCSLLSRITANQCGITRFSAIGHIVYAPFYRSGLFGNWCLYHPFNDRTIADLRCIQTFVSYSPFVPLTLIPSLVYTRQVISAHHDILGILHKERVQERVRRITKRV